MNQPKAPLSPFKLGQRVNDPTLSLGDDRIRLNVNVFPQDFELLKVIDLQRGVIQTTVVNLIHSFCNVLRSYGITNRTQLDKFHYALAAWSGRYECEPFVSVDGEGKEITCADFMFFPGLAYDTAGSEVRRGTNPQDSGQVDQGYERPGTPGALRVSSLPAQVTSNATGEGEKGRGAARRNVRGAGGQKDPVGGGKNPGGKDKVQGSKRGSTGSKAGK